MAKELPKAFIEGFWQEIRLMGGSPSPKTRRQMQHEAAIANFKERARQARWETGEAARLERRRIGWLGVKIILGIYVAVGGALLLGAWWQL